MGVRETLRANPGKATVTAIVLLVGGVVYFYSQWSTADPGTRPPTKLFVSTDGGKTYITLPADRLPPFEHEGKTAYRAYVFTCDGGRTKFVGYLERYSDRTKATMLEMWKRQAATGEQPALASGLFEGIEVMRPGGKQWVKQSDLTRAIEVMDVRCPNDPAKAAEMVLP
jgi:hypothetical protein